MEPVTKRKRRTKQEARQLQRRVWSLRREGWSCIEIAEQLRESRQLVEHHLRRARTEFASTEVQDLAPIEKVAEALASFRSIRVGIQRDLEETPVGSSARARLQATLVRSLLGEVKFLLDIGEMRRLADLVREEAHEGLEIRRLTTPQLEAELERLRLELLNGNVRKRLSK